MQPEEIWHKHFCTGKMSPCEVVNATLLIEAILFRHFLTKKWVVLKSGMVVVLCTTA